MPWWLAPLTGTRANTSRQCCTSHAAAATAAVRPPATPGAPRYTSSSRLHSSSLKLTTKRVLVCLAATTLEVLPMLFAVVPVCCKSCCVHLKGAGRCIPRLCCGAVTRVVCQFFVAHACQGCSQLASVAFGCGFCGHLGPCPSQLGSL